MLSSGVRTRWVLLGLTFLLAVASADDALNTPKLTIIPTIDPSTKLSKTTTQQPTVTSEDLHTDKGTILDSGLGFIPMPPKSSVESTLIWLKADDEENVNYWTNEIDNFLTVYRKPADASAIVENRVPCGHDSPPPEGKVCDVPVDSFKPCVSKNKYSYRRRSPCIFLKLDKIYNWKPQTYNDTTSLPEKMPNDLKEYIKNQRNFGPRNLDTVWVSCEGENPADNENIGAIQYIPSRGFPGYYFPFTNTDGYLSPLVAVLFDNLASGVLINIECKAWAKNIKHDRHEQRGSVHFELLID